MARVITVTIPTKNGEELAVSIETNRGATVSEKAVLRDTLRDLYKASAHVEKMLRDLENGGTV